MPSPMEIASEYARRWETAWNFEGPAATAALYTADGVLVGRVIDVGRPAIARQLQVLFQLGWTRVAIRVVNARAVGGVVLAVSEFSASRSGQNDGKEFTGRSSHVLTEVAGTWLSAMHTAV
jgi:uncharacterized protein (TIGR02246 family)